MRRMLGGLLLLALALGAWVIRALALGDREYVRLAEAGWPDGEALEAGIAMVRRRLWPWRRHDRVH